jgi:hypothetical protein
VRIVLNLFAHRASRAIRIPSAKCMPLPYTPSILYESPYQ